MLKKVMALQTAGMVFICVIIWFGLNYRLQIFAGKRLDIVGLEAKIQQYAALAGTIENRPKHDREALQTLVEQFGHDKSDFVSIFQNNCADVDLQLESDKDQIALITRVDDRYREILENGFVLQSDIRSDEIIPENYQYREFFDLQMETALQDMQNSQPQAAADRMILNLQMIDGLYATPLLISIMTGEKLELDYQRTLVYLLPQLTNSDIKRIEQAFGNIRTPHLALMDGFKVECAMFNNKMDRMQNDGNVVYWESYNQLDGIHKFIWRQANFARGEKLLFTKIMSERIEGYIQWIEHERQVSVLEIDSKYDEQFDFANLSPHLLTPIVASARPNYFSLILRVWNLERKREALLSALEAELERREADPDQKITLLYGEDEQIVLGPEHGCIEKKEESAIK